MVMSFRWDNWGMLLFLLWHKHRHNAFHQLISWSIIRWFWYICWMTPLQILRRRSCFAVHFHILKIARYSCKFSCSASSALKTNDTVTCLQFFSPKRPSLHDLPSCWRALHTSSLQSISQRCELSKNFMELWTQRVLTYTLLSYPYLHFSSMCCSHSPSMAEQTRPVVWSWATHCSVLSWSIVHQANVTTCTADARCVRTVLAAQTWTIFCPHPPVIKPSTCLLYTSPSPRD